MPVQDDAGDLSHEEINRILTLIDQFDKSGMTYLHLETRALKLTLSKDRTPGAAREAIPSPARVDARSGALAPASEQRIVTAATEHSVPQDGVVPILAQMVGRFYVAPEPGAAPFVSVGSRVDEETTVGLIEVMKVFNAVKAGVRGVITRVCAEDGQFVEYGQVLFLVQTEDRAGQME